MIKWKIVCHQHTFRRTLIKLGFSSFFCHGETSGSGVPRASRPTVSPPTGVRRSCRAGRPGPPLAEGQGVLPKKAQTFPKLRRGRCPHRPYAEGFFLLQGRKTPGPGPLRTAAPTKSEKPFHPLVVRGALAPPGPVGFCLFSVETENLPLWRGEGAPRHKSNGDNQDVC